MKEEKQLVFAYMMRLAYDLLTQVSNSSFLDEEYAAPLGNILICLNQIIDQNP